MLSTAQNKQDTHKVPFTSSLYSSFRNLAHGELENNINKDRTHRKLHYRSESCNKNGDVKRLRFKERVS